MLRLIAGLELPDAGAVETRRAQWRVALGALATAARA
jgi:ABC-type sulfate/molybdate transport systems ATPase subunit